MPRASLNPLQRTHSPNYFPPDNQSALDAALSPPQTSELVGQILTAFIYSCAPPQPFDFADGRRLQARVTTHGTNCKWTTQT
eukprot:scaffold108752_cov17-Prasinocladus_malaysianus.AAC.1